MSPTYFTGVLGSFWSLGKKARALRDNCSKCCIYTTEVLGEFRELGSLVGQEPNNSVYLAPIGDTSSFDFFYQP